MQGATASWYVLTTTRRRKSVQAELHGADSDNTPYHGELAHVVVAINARVESNVSYLPVVRKKERMYIARKLYGELAYVS